MADTIEYKRRIPLIQTTTYRLPHLRYLRPKYLVFSLVYSALFIVVVVGILLGSPRLVEAVNNTEGLAAVCLLFASLTVANQLIRLAVLAGVRHDKYDQTIIAQYEPDASPVEASILLHTGTTADFGRQLVQSLMDKGAIRVIPVGRGKVRVLDETNITPLTPYEDVAKHSLLDEKREVVMSTRKLLKGRAIRRTEKVVFASLAARGYFKKRTALEEGLGQYLSVFNYIHPFGFVSYLAVVLLFGTLLMSPGNFIDTQTLSRESTYMVAASLAIAVLIPLGIYLRSVFTGYGTKKFALTYGFYWYLRDVYKHRLASSYVPDNREERLYGAYFDAFGWRKPRRIG